MDSTSASPSTATINQPSGYNCSETSEVAKKEANLLANLIGRSGLTDCDVDCQSKDNNNNLSTFDMWMDMDEIDLEVENQDNSIKSVQSSSSSKETIKSINQSNQIDIDANCSSNHLDKVKHEMNINLRDECAQINNSINSGDDLLSLVDS